MSGPANFRRASLRRDAAAGEARTSYFELFTPSCFLQRRIFLTHLWRSECGRFLSLRGVATRQKVRRAIKFIGLFSLAC